MRILQSDIFGKNHEDPSTSKKQQGSASKKKASGSFPTITLQDGLKTSQEIASNSMFIHRALEKRIINGGLQTQKAKQTFERILRNELLLKKGMMDPTTLTRDTLIAYFISLSKNL